MRMAFDCRHLTRKEKYSLGLVLESIIELCPYDDIVLLSDTALDKKYIRHGWINLVYGTSVKGAKSIIKYLLWERDSLKDLNMSVLYRVGGGTLFSIKDVKIITQIPDIYIIRY